MKTLTRLLTNNQLHRLQHQANGFNDLQQIVNQYLEPTACQHCWVGSYKMGKLTLITDSAAWATRLRYLTPELIKQLKLDDIFNNLNEITCRVSPNQHQPLKSIKNPSTKMSNHSAKVINEAADAIIDPQLKQALKQLARHTEMN